MLSLISLRESVRCAAFCERELGRLAWVVPGTRFSSWRVVSAGRAGRALNVDARSP
jgi:hypothetical protein